MKKIEKILSKKFNLEHASVAGDHLKLIMGVLE